MEPTEGDSVACITRKDFNVSSLRFLGLAIGLSLVSWLLLGDHNIAN